MPVRCNVMARIGRRAGVIAALLLLSLAAFTPRPAVAARDCGISDLATLKSCLARPDAYDSFTFTRDLSCSSDSDCCGAGATPLLRLQNVAGKVIDGAGHILHRARPLACVAIEFDNVKGVTLRNLSLDEDERVPPCKWGDQVCPNTVYVNASTEVALDNVHVYFGKGYAVRAWTTDGFSFTRSSVADSGIIGLYVGHFKFGPSHRVRITDSVFARSSTSGIALAGADGASPADPVLIANNVFVGNHWHGFFPSAAVPGGIAGGGQLLVADGNNIRVTGNLFADSYCETCHPTDHATVIEISDQAKPPGGVSGLTIDHNLMVNGTGVAVYLNAGMLGTGITLDSNRLRGFSTLDIIAAPATIANNVLASPGATPSRRGEATNRVLRIAGDATHEAVIAGQERAGARPEGQFVLARAPRPGAPATPVFHCVAAGRGFVSTARNCDGAGEVDAVLGFPYEPGHPGARPVFECAAATGPSRFLSWSADCEGARKVASLGAALATAPP